MFMLLNSLQTEVEEHFLNILGVSFVGDVGVLDLHLVTVAEVALTRLTMVHQSVIMETSEQIYIFSPKISGNIW